MRAPTKLPRKIFVLIMPEFRPIAEIMLAKIGTITAIVPPLNVSYPWRIELENKDWPSGPFTQATAQFSEERDGMATSLKLELVMP